MALKRVLSHLAHCAQCVSISLDLLLGSRDALPPNFKVDFTILRMGCLISKSTSSRSKSKSPKIRCSRLECITLTLLAITLVQYCGLLALPVGDRLAFLLCGDYRHVIPKMVLVPTWGITLDWMFSLYVDVIFLSGASVSLYHYFADRSNSLVTKFMITLIREKGTNKGATK